VRLKSGWLDLNRDQSGVWRLSWAPDPGKPGFPGCTHSPGDQFLPDGIRGLTIRTR